MNRLSPEDIWVPLRRRLSRIRREHREWDRRLRELDYVPQAVEQPTGPNDVIICGSPRSGTTLLAAQLFQPPRIVTVTEPWDGLRYPPAKVFQSMRDELANGHLRSTKLDADARRAGRVEWATEGLETEVTVDSDVIVAVKWPTWWHYLDRLPNTRFLVTLRDPAEVLESYARTGGHLREGQDYPVALNADVNHAVRATAGRNLARRRAALYETINRALLPHLDRENVLPVRYERWFDDPDGLRHELSIFLGVPLEPWPVEVRLPASTSRSRAVRDLIRAHVAVARELAYER